MSEYTINDIADYIISHYYKEDFIGHSKLQIILFYCQAWYLSEYKIPLFSDNFEARVFGPTNKNLFERFGSYLYKVIGIGDIRPSFNENLINEDARILIDEVLSEYNEYDSTQLIDIVRRELPWKLTRKGLDPAEKCNNIIDKNLMMKYYSMKMEEYIKENKLIEEFENNE